MDCQLVNHLSSSGPKHRAIKLAVYFFLFVILYIFFRYAHPIMVWCGDDWYSLCDWGDPYIFLDLNTEYTTSTPSNLLGNALGHLTGFLAAFLIYPITGNYLLSFVTADAIAVSVCVCITVYSVNSFFFALTNSKIYSYLAALLYILCAFSFFKASNPGQHLFWSYDRCAAYYYAIPNYIGCALLLYSLKCMLNSSKTGSSICLSTGVMFALIYVLVFSFLPTAELLAAFAALNLLYDFAASRDLKAVVKKDWLSLVTIALFPIKLYIEFKRTFSIGYFSPNSSFLTGVVTAFKEIMLSFTRMHLLFKFFAILGVVIFAYLAFTRFVRKRDKFNFDAEWLKVFTILVGLVGLQIVFFSLFGGVEWGHVFNVSDSGVRTDTTFSLYFVLIVVVVFIWISILKACRGGVLIIPVWAVMMFCVAINPANAYSESHFNDTTAQQKYEIMNAIVEEAIARDARGEYTLTVHMPQVNYFGGYGMTAALQYHNLTDGRVNIIEVFDAPSCDVYFE